MIHLIYMHTGLEILFWERVSLRAPAAFLMDLCNAARRDAPEISWKQEPRPSIYFSRVHDEYRTANFQYILKKTLTAEEGKKKKKKSYRRRALFRLTTSATPTRLLLTPPRRRWACKEASDRFFFLDKWRNESLKVDLLTRTCSLLPLVGALGW